MTARTAQDLRDEQAEEYGTFRAASVIFIDGVRAFNVGDLVPRSHVTRGVVNEAQVDAIAPEKQEI